MVAAVGCVGVGRGRHVEGEAAGFEGFDDGGAAAVRDEDVVGEVGRDEEDRTVVRSAYIHGNIFERIWPRREVLTFRPWQADSLGPERVGLHQALRRLLALLQSPHW